MDAISFKRIAFFLVGSLLPDSRSVKNVRVSGMLLVLSNLVPIGLHVVGGWDMSDSLLLYWMENLIIGFYAIFRIILAKVPESNVQSSLRALNTITDIAQKIPIVLFFLVHYTGFCIGHGIFVIMALAITSLDTSPYGTAIIWSKLIQKSSWYFYAIVILLISHGYSFLVNYIGNGEFRSMSPGKAMLAPYKRIAVVHLSIFASFFGSTLFGNTLGSLIGFTFVKTVFDLFAHAHEHGNGSAPKAYSLKQNSVVTNNPMAWLRLIIVLLQAVMILCFFVFIVSLFIKLHNLGESNRLPHTDLVSFGGNNYAVRLSSLPDWNATYGHDGITMKRNGRDAVLVIDISPETTCSRVFTLTAFSDLFPQEKMIHLPYDTNQGYESWSFGGYEAYSGAYNMQRVRRYPAGEVNYCMNISQYDATPTSIERSEMELLEKSLLFEVL